MQRKGAMNWADLSSLLIIIAGAMGGLAGARPSTAEAGTTILLVVCGLMAGYCMAILSSVCACSTLDSERSPVGARIVVYFLLPIVLLLATVIGTAMFASWLASHFPLPILFVLVASLGMLIGVVSWLVRHPL